MKSRDQKIKEALIRNTYWASLSPANQLAYLDQNNFRAIKQRAKIARRMNHGR
jgi:hypothetical protein